MSSEFDEFKDREYADWKRIRSALEHENTLVNHRVTWLLTSQAFLIAALVAVFNEAQKPECLDEQQAWIFSLTIAAVSITICLAIGRSLGEASYQLDHLDKWWYRKWNSNKDWKSWEDRETAIARSLRRGHPEIQGRRSKRILNVCGVQLWPFTFGTVVFVLQCIWGLVICISLSNVFPILWGAFTKARPDPRLIRNSLTPGDLTLLYSVDKKDIPVGYQDLDSRSSSKPIELIAKAKIKISKKHGQVFADQEMVRIYRNLAKRNDAYRLPLALALSDLGVTRADLKDWNKSLSATNEALILIEQIAQEKPMAKGELAAILNNLGVIFREKGDSRKARAYIERSRLLYISLFKSNPAFSDSLGIVNLNSSQHL